MKGVNTWSYKPYHPALHANHQIYISRLAPGQGSISLNWFPENGAQGPYTVCCKKRSCAGDMPITRETMYTFAEIKGLEDECDYEIHVSCAEGESCTRLFRTGFVPGTVVNYLHPEDDVYRFSGQSLCSPSLLKLDDGALLASMDVYKHMAPQNLTLVFKSTDNGQTWEHLTELFPCFWGKLFLHKNALYMLAMSTEYGDILIGRSDDGGKSFCMPTVIARGSCSSASPGYQRAPMPITAYKGRLWTAVDYGIWGLAEEAGFSECMLSIDEDADLMKAENWTITTPLPYSPGWHGAVDGRTLGCIEGSAVAAPGGELVVVLRYETKGCTPSYGKAVVLKADSDDPDKTLEFLRIIDFEGNLSKFDIIYDEVSRKYISLITGTYEHQNRTILSFAVSDDLFNWRTACPLLDYSFFNPEKVGFQYASFIIDGDDLLYLSRTSFNNAKDFHDANYSTFHRIENFRKYL